jgi:hypothetical protein
MLGNPCVSIGVRANNLPVTAVGPCHNDSGGERLSEANDVACIHNEFEQLLQMIHVQNECLEQLETSVARLHGTIASSSDPQLKEAACVS